MNAQLLAQAGLEAARLLGHQDKAAAAAAAAAAATQKKEDAQTQQQRQAAAKLALRKQLEKTLLQVREVLDWVTTTLQIKFYLTRNRARKILRSKVNDIVSDSAGVDTVSVAEPRHFDADQDPTFYFDSDPSGSCSSSK